jgi:hypothetical protein
VSTWRKPVVVHFRDTPETVMNEDQADKILKELRIIKICVMIPALIVDGVSSGKRFPRASSPLILRAETANPI